MRHHHSEPDQNHYSQVQPHSGYKLKVLMGQHCPSRLYTGSNTKPLLVDQILHILSKLAKPQHEAGCRPWAAVHAWSHFTKNAYVCACISIRLFCTVKWSSNTKSQLTHKHYLFSQHIICFWQRPQDNITNQVRHSSTKMQGLFSDVS